ncbi:MAG: DUF1156 domain-containing protein, partial [Bacteroidetes bacterium]|nr:DUF1156 domain-containing protein [Bacteroidota bacterium]
EAYASDLNPVAVLINKAMIEIPPKFTNRPPVGPIPDDERQQEMPKEWNGAQGLAEDVRRYGHWMRDEAYKRIGHLYPQVEITKEMAKGRPDLTPYVGRKLTVIAWLWARTVKSPNPAYSHVDVPLVSSFLLSTKKGKEAWVKPVVDGDSYRFEVKIGTPPEDAKSGTKLSRGANFMCLMSQTPIESKYIYESGKAGRIGQRLMAVVAEGDRGRVYLSPVDEMEGVALSAKPDWAPSLKMPDNPRWFSPPMYGMETYGELFTPRQLVALNTFSDLVQEARSRVIADAMAAGMDDDKRGIEGGGTGATAYGDAVAVYLGLGVSRLTDILNSLCGWETSKTQVRHVFTRHAIPMMWDFGENNVFGGAAGDYLVSLTNLTKFLERLRLSVKAGHAGQADVTNQSISAGKVVSTDPPYYDNIGYADLSDFFYVWLRKVLKPVLPGIFSTISVPKDDELIASPYRQGSREAAEMFFLDGMKHALMGIATQSHRGTPVTLYYAFKQSETNGDITSSTGWETFLEAIMESNLSVTGTWPMRTELGNRMISSGTNALASSIVLVCRPRSTSANPIPRRSFQRELREEMPQALKTMIGGSTGRSPIAPVDLAQAAIGPGMAIFSKYEAVLNQDGSRMSVHDALVLINREISDYLNPEAGDFDADTLFCTAWFDQYGWKKGPFGEADVLARAKGTSVDGVRESGVIEAKAGKVGLIRWDKYPKDWDPARDTRTPVWEACHHMIRLLDSRGEADAGTLLASMPERGEKIRQLAYHLYTICDRNKWSEDARPYNNLVTAWSGIIVASSGGPSLEQTEMEL